MEAFEVGNGVLPHDSASNNAEGEAIDLQARKAMREEVACSIDPDTAEVTFRYRLTLDPYGELEDIAEEFRQVGREYFPRPPGGDIWVWFGDLPKATRDAL